MATNLSVLIKYSDGGFTYLRDEIASSDGTFGNLLEIQTDASGLVNQTGNVSVGQADTGRVAIAALAKVQSDSVATGSYLGGGFYSPQGDLICPVQGGGSNVTGLPKLIKPVRMQTGIVFKGMWMATADAVASACSLVVYTTDGKCDWFSAAGSDDADVALVNKESSTLGQALAGSVCAAAYAVNPSLYGLADTGVADGVGAYFVESSSGTLKAMFAPCQNSASPIPAPWIPQTFRIEQNDTLTARANV